MTDGIGSPPASIHAKGPFGGRLALTAKFLAAAARYWLGVYPRVRLETRRWQRRADRIPDPTLRQTALWNLAAESANLEGAAAFATFVPRDRRSAVVRAQVTFQVIYDYVDSLAEQPYITTASGRQLHAALLEALTPDTSHSDYYAHHPSIRRGSTRYRGWAIFPSPSGRRARPRRTWGSTGGITALPPARRWSCLPS